MRSKYEDLLARLSDLCDNLLGVMWEATFELASIPADEPPKPVTVKSLCDNAGVLQAIAEAIYAMPYHDDPDCECNKIVCCRQLDGNGALSGGGCPVANHTAITCHVHKPAVLEAIVARLRNTL